jgi:hypothetical protein
MNKYKWLYQLSSILVVLTAVIQIIRLDFAFTIPIAILMGVHVWLSLSIVYQAITDESFCLEEIILMHLRVTFMISVMLVAIFTMIQVLLFFQSDLLILRWFNYLLYLIAGIMILTISPVLFLPKTFVKSFNSKNCEEAMIFKV